MAKFTLSVLNNYGETILTDYDAQTARTNGLTFNETASLSTEGPTLNFSMLKYYYEGSEKRVNTAAMSLFYGSTIKLLTNGQRYDFSINKIDYQFMQDNLQLNFSATNAFQFETSNQGVGYTIEADTSSPTFLGAQSIDSWARKIVADNNLRWTYVAIDKANDMLIHYLSDQATIVTRDTITEEGESAWSEIEQDYSVEPQKNLATLNAQVSFSCSNSNAYAALKQLATENELFIIVDYGARNFWFAPIKNPWFKGYYFNPNNNLQDFSLSGNGTNLVSVLNVQGPTDYNDKLITLVPEIPPTVRTFIQSPEWKESVYIPTMYQELYNGVEKTSLDNDFLAQINQTPWFENKLINIDYFKESGILLEFEANQIYDIFYNQLRIVNAPMMMRYADYISQYEKDLMTINDENITVERLMAEAQGDYENIMNSVFNTTSHYVMVPIKIPFNTSPVETGVVASARTIINENELVAANVQYRYDAGWSDAGNRIKILNEKQTITFNSFSAQWSNSTIGIETLPSITTETAIVGSPYENCDDIQSAVTGERTITLLQSNDFTRVGAVRVRISYGSLQDATSVTLQRNNNWSIIKNDQGQSFWPDMLQYRTNNNGLYLRITTSDSTPVTIGLEFIEGTVRFDDAAHTSYNMRVLNKEVHSIYRGGFMDTPTYQYSPDISRSRFGISWKLQNGLEGYYHSNNSISPWSLNTGLPRYIDDWAYDIPWQYGSFEICGLQCSGIVTDILEYDIQFLQSGTYRWDCFTTDNREIISNPVTIDLDANTGIYLSLYNNFLYNGTRVRYQENIIPTTTFTGLAEHLTEYLTTLDTNWQLLLKNSYNFNVYLNANIASYNELRHIGVLTTSDDNLTVSMLKIPVQAFYQNPFVGLNNGELLIFGAIIDNVEYSSQLVWPPVEGQEYTVNINTEHLRFRWENWSPAPGVPSELYIYIVYSGEITPLPQGSVWYCSKMANQSANRPYPITPDMYEQVQELHLTSRTAVIQWCAATSAKLTEYWQQMQSGATKIGIFIPSDWDCLDTLEEEYPPLYLKQLPLIKEVDTIKLNPVYGGEVVKTKASKTAKYAWKYIDTDSQQVDIITDSNTNSNVFMLYDENTLSSILEQDYPYTDYIYHGHKVVLDNLLLVVNKLKYYDSYYRKNDDTALSFNDFVSINSQLANWGVPESMLNNDDGIITPDNILYNPLFSFINWLSQSSNTNYADYYAYLAEHNAIWRKLYHDYPGVFRETVYENTDAATSLELYQAARKQLEKLSQPEFSYNLTGMDIYMHDVDYNPLALQVGDQIRIDYEEDMFKLDSLNKALREPLYVTAIDRTLRNDGDYRFSVVTRYATDTMLQRFAQLLNFGRR